MSTVKSKKLQVGTDASASNNFTIYQPATPDGTLRIGVGNADSPTEVARFDSTGLVPGTIPAFNAYVSSSQNINHATWTKINFATEVYDTDTMYDTSTSRFQPTKAGYYQISVRVELTSFVNAQSLMAIYKNGSEYHRVGAAPWVSCAGIQGSALVYFNGSTDYLETYYYQASGGTKATATNNGVSYFEGVLVKAE